MKKILSIVAVSLLVTACNEPTTTSKKSPLEGNWEMVSNEINGKKTNPKRFPQQLKMLHDGFISVIMYDEAGKFYLSASGTYDIDGNMYKETANYHSNTDYIGFKNWEKWEMKGDTLIFYGFEKAEMPDGKDVTAEMNKNGKFIEKRIRAKR